MSTFKDRSYSDGNDRKAHIHSSIPWSSMVKLSLLVKKTGQSLSAVAAQCINKGVAQVARDEGVSLPKVKPSITKATYLRLVRKGIK